MPDESGNKESSTLESSAPSRKKRKIRNPFDKFQNKTNDEMLKLKAEIRQKDLAVQRLQTELAKLDSLARRALKNFALSLTSSVWRKFSLNI